MNLSENQIRGEPHNPGAGGWPTIRYFNKETGIDGGTYEKKTDKSMCEELGGDGEMLSAYVEEAGDTSLCSVGEGYPGCDEKETAYIDKMKSQPTEAHKAQLERLGKMELSSMTPELQQWLVQRKKILKQLVASSSGSDEL